MKTTRWEGVVLLATVIGFGCTFTAEIGEGLYAVTNGDPDSTHTWVGALVFDRGDAWFGTCSGSLISPTVFLTAGHCVNPLIKYGYPMGVTFEEFISEPLSPEVVATIIRGTGYLHPEFSPVSYDYNGDPHDLAVVVLQTPVTDRPLSRLPSAGLLDQLRAMHLLESHSVFTVVGYGWSGATIPIRGNQDLYLRDQRLNGTEDFLSLQDVWVHAHSNQNQGFDSPCFGDSGGPDYLEVGGQEIQVSTTTIIGSDCRNGGEIYNYRLDTPGARSFLGQFVTLP